MDFKKLSEFLAEFEETRGAALKELTIKSVLAWPVVKTPLYFGVIKSAQTNSTLQNGQQRKNFHADRVLERVFGIFGLIARLISVGLSGIFGPKRVLICASTNDKISKEAGGKYINYLTDIIVKENLLPAYLYAEVDHYNGKKSPSFIEVGFPLNELRRVDFVYRYFARKNKEIKAVAKQLFETMNTFFESKAVHVDFSEDLLERILMDFVIDYQLSDLFLSVSRPAFLITAEMPGTGMLAAANKRRIKSIDLQHGIIDKHHPQYIYSNNFTAVREKMAMPTFVGVFGQLYKNILTEAGFWDTSSVVILGSSKVDISRQIYRGKLGSQKHKPVLIPSQWTYKPEIFRIVSYLLTNLSDDFRVDLKLHPMEESNSGEYDLLLKQFPDKLKIHTKESDIYPMIADAFVVVGVDSAVLVEAVSLSKPCITVTTETSPDGIHSLLQDGLLKTVIESVRIEDLSAMCSLIEKASSDPFFYKEWTSKTDTTGEYLFAKDYSENCRKFFNSQFSAT